MSESIRKKYCVNGEWKESKATRYTPVTDSSTGKVIAEVPCCTEDEVLEALEAGASQPVSLDMQTSDEDEGLKLSSVLGTEDKGFASFENADLLRRSMAKLTDQQKEIIYLRFFENLSQREVAQRIGISQMTVSRAERSALEKMRQEMGDINL